MTAFRLYMRVGDETDVIAARAAGGRIARSTGFDNAAIQCIVTSISELANNIVLHAGSGDIRLSVIRVDGKRGLEVVATDSGRGIADVDRALTDGFSTNGGLGSGLPGARRMMSELSVDSDLGRGTVVRAVKWLQ
jgi:serine/threonine-protein kinase RsbT